MHIDAALNPAEIALLPARDLSATTCVVFDILRATSSMITAFAHGAAEIYPVRTIGEARALQATRPHALLAGERHGDLIPGFALGNSPLEYREEIAGRTIISTTTNGTIALRACEGAARVLVGAILNLAAVGEELQRAQPAHVLLVCAGTFSELALEDVWAAGRLIQKLRGVELSDAARTAAALAGHHADPLSVLQAAKNGRVLAAKNRGAEVEWCARLSRYKILAEMQAAVIRPLPS